MRVISKSRLQKFWERVGCEDSEEPLKAWYRHVNSHAVDWTKWADVRSTFGNADVVGNCVVFNVAGNKYRLIARVMYSRHKVYVLKVMTHREYDGGRWKADCGCFTPPPPERRKKK